jgi:hypothetical protein
MRWATYRSPRDSQDRIGLLHEDAVHGLAEPHSLVEALRGGQDVPQLATETALTSPDEVIPAAQVVLRAPVPVPPSIRDFMAFEEHVVTSMKAIGRSVDPVWYQIPVFYFTNPAAYTGPTRRSRSRSFEKDKSRRRRSSRECGRRRKRSMFVEGWPVCRQWWNPLVPVLLTTSTSELISARSARRAAAP